MAKRKQPSRPRSEEKGKQRAILIRMDEEVRNELEFLSLSRRKSIQELGLEAICDLLKKHGRPVSMLDAFKQSAGVKKPARKKTARKKTARKKSARTRQKAA